MQKLFLVLFVLNAFVLNAQQTYSDYVKMRFTQLRLPQPPHAQEVRQNNEIVENTTVKSAYFSENPLRLNGEQLDFENFYLSSKGILSLVREDNKAKKGQAVPFYVTIRRNGALVQDKKMPFLNKAFIRVNLSEIFPFSQPGDVMIIHPAQEEDWKGKRILKLMSMNGC